MRIFSLEAKIQFCLMFTAFGRCILLPASPMGQYFHACFLTKGFFKYNHHYLVYLNDARVHILCFHEIC